MRKAGESSMHSMRAHSSCTRDGFAELACLLAAPPARRLPQRASLQRARQLPVCCAAFEARPRRQEVRPDADITCGGSAADET